MPGPSSRPRTPVVIGAAELAQRTPPRLVDTLADIPGTGRVEDGASGVADGAAALGARAR